MNGRNDNNYALRNSGAVFVIRPMPVAAVRPDRVSFSWDQSVKLIPKIEMD